MPSQAASVMWNFTGAFSSTDYGPHGTTLTGSVTFDSAASLVTLSSTDGYFPAASFSFTVSGYPGNVTHTGTSPFIEVYNDEIGSFEMLKISSPVSISNPDNVLNLIWQTATLTLYDTSQTTFLPSPHRPPFPAFPDWRQQP